MKNQDWVKTLLTTYRYLDKLCNSIDKIIETRAVNSFYFNLQNSAFNEAFNVANDIIELTEHKKTLINLKVITTNMLKSLDSKFARVLIMKYIENTSFPEISKRIFVSQRSAFRYHDIGLIHAAFYLDSINYTPEKILNMVKNEHWIIELFSEFSKTNSKKAVSVGKDMKATNIVKTACSEYKNVVFS